MSPIDPPMSAPRGPLAGIRVIDMTAALAGAFTTMMLADLGAEVIKVESRQHYPYTERGPRDPLRTEDPAGVSARRDYPNADPGEDPWNRICWFNSHARNKRSVTMDVSRPLGRDAFLRLVDSSDGMVDNHAPGMLDRFGLGYDMLRERNPGFIIVSLPALGLSGPDHRAMGYGWHFEEYAGFLEVQGYPDGEPVGSIYMDGATGPVGANGFVMALIERRITGQGAIVELAQVENLAMHLGDVVMEAAMQQQPPRRWGNRSPDAAPQGVYPCSGDDQWIVLTIRHGADWSALRTVLDDPPGWDQASLATTVGRHAAHDELDATIAAWTSARTKWEAFAVLRDAGIPAGPVMDEADALADPHLHERGFFELLDHPSAGTHFHPGVNFHLSRTPAVVWRSAPTVGQDNHYVYRDVIGVSDEEYQQLANDGHIGTTFE